MWKLKSPDPVKVIVGIMAADQASLVIAKDMLEAKLGKFDLISDIWPFNQTTYYKDQTGEDILRQFVSVEKLICPGRLAKIKHQTNQMEQKLAKQLKSKYPRPINFDPGIIEPSKLILASTKNFSHRIYIGEKIYAEVTLSFDKGAWRFFPYTYPDYKQQCYFDFFNKMRKKLLEQLKSEN